MLASRRTFVTETFFLCCYTTKRRRVTVPEINSHIDKLPQAVEAGGLIRKCAPRASKSAAFMKDEHLKTGEAQAATTKQNVCVGTHVSVGTLVCVRTHERRPDQASGALASNAKYRHQDEHAKPLKQKGCRNGQEKARNSKGFLGLRRISRDTQNEREQQGTPW